MLLCVVPGFAQEAAQGGQRVYAELVGVAANALSFNKSVKIMVDLGQYQSAWKNYTLQDERGRDIKFNSMVAAMNYMGERGWKFVQVYTVEDNERTCYHWLLYKDITDKAQITEGLHIKHME